MAVQEYFVAMLDQGGAQFRGTPDCDVPVLGIVRDGL
jgi:hypothetical protein